LPDRKGDGRILPAVDVQCGYKLDRVIGDAVHRDLDIIRLEAAKTLAYNICIGFNLQLNRPPVAFTGLIDS
jgi:hypothetical protein